MFAGLDQWANVSRRLSAVGLGPGEFLFQREAAAVPFPAFSSGETPAGTVLAGKPATAVLGCSGLRDRQGKAERDKEVAEQSQHHHAATQWNSMPCSDPFPHGRFTSWIEEELAFYKF